MNQIASSASEAVKPSLATIVAPVVDDLEAVDQVVRSSLASDVPLVAQIADHILGAGGKRLRPTVLLLVARALGYTGTGHHVLAAVIEFIHTATLLHDDVVDDSSLRRGRSTANSLFGNPASVLVGDFLYSRAFQMMVSLRLPSVLEILSDATNRIAEGEVMQLMFARDPSLDEHRYLQIVDRKTATLFAAATQIGAVIANANDDLARHCRAYGQHLGTAFQMIDDVLDYAGDAERMGKQVGDDLREGKCTLPLIFALQAASDAERREVERAIHQRDGDFARIAAVVERTGAVARVRALASAELRAAERAAMQLAPSDFRYSLLDLNSFALDRDR